MHALIEYIGVRMCDYVILARESLRIPALIRLYVLDPGLEIWACLIGSMIGVLNSLDGDSNGLLSLHSSTPDAHNDLRRSITGLRSQKAD